jgi:cell division protein FtsZ
VHQPSYEAEPIAAEPRHEVPLFAGLHLDDVQDDLADDDAYAPAYRPVEAAPDQGRFAADPATSFVPPQAPPAGQPTPEAMARLRAAIQKEVPRDAAPAPQEVPQKQRLSLNSLIGRMTGNSDEAASQPADRRQPLMSGGMPARQAPAATPSARAHPEEAPFDAEQERIEIPAFLRRQAN